VDAQVTTVSQTAEPTNVLIVGVGGQGVIMVSKVLATLCLGRDMAVKQSEVHGMAKRGGAVFSHVRFGETVWSPTIPKGKADVLIALEWAEALRWLDYINPETGVLIADTKRIVPPFSCRDRRAGAASSYLENLPSEVIAELAEGYALDASGIARDFGNERAANTVLLGALSTVLPFSAEEWTTTLADFVPPKTININKAAFEAGRNWVRAHDGGGVAEPVAEVVAPIAPLGQETVSVDIVEEWCKSCDICVRICPERCLALNQDQIVEVTDLDACTGCRLCEWLCPDFAITISHTYEQTR
jgi:indolepyruvate ferredoxin oxidoreductase beta subunit